MGDRVQDRSVTITTFVTPHLFWIFPETNRRKRDALEKELNSFSKYIIRKNPEPGELVLVKNIIWKRALIKAVDELCICWLIDYGVPFETKEVYNLKEAYRSRAPLTNMVALNNSICISKVFDVDGSLSGIEAANFNAGTIKSALSHIKDAKIIYFNHVRNCGDIQVGNVIIINWNGTRYDLAKALAEEGLISFNEKLFDKVISGFSAMNDFTFVAFLKKWLGRDAFSASNSVQRRNTPVQSEKPPIENTCKIQYPKRWMQTIQAINKIKEADANSGVASQYLSAKSNQTVSKERRDKEDLSKPPAGSSRDNNWTSGARNQDFHRSRSAKKTPAQTKARSVSLSNVKSCLKTKNDTESSTLPPSKSSKDDSDVNLIKKKLVTFKSATDTQDSALEFTSVPSKIIEKFSNTVKWRALDVLSGSASNTDPIIVQGSQNQNAPPDAFNKKPAQTRRNLDYNWRTERSDQHNLQFGNHGNDPHHTTERRNESVPVSNLKYCPVTCRCGSCGSWTTSMLHEGRDLPIHADVRRKKKVHVQPVLLLKPDSNTLETINIQTAPLIHAHQSKIQRATAPKVLIHGTTIPAPILSVNAAAFPKDIQRALRLFEQVYSVQSYVWPALMRQMNVCVVNSKKTGKTMAYLPPICSFVLDRKDRYASLPNNNSTISPLVIILCPGVKVAEEVHRQVGEVLSFAFCKPSVVLATSPLDADCLGQFYKQCDVLVSTPTSLVSLFSSKLITAKRVCHFVIESADIVLELFGKELEQLLGLMQSMLSHRVCLHTVQMVVVSEKWSLQLENLLKQFNVTPLVCIGSYLEAALYARVHLQIHFLEARIKKTTLGGVLMKQASTCKSVVLCKTNEEIVEIKEHLESINVNAYYVYDNMDAHEIIKIETKWMETPAAAIVCTDIVFNHTLNINNADLLVNYSLPTSWTQFTTRFNCLMSNYVSPLSLKGDPDAHPHCKVHIFIDETCRTQFPKLFRLLLRFNSKLPPKFLQYYEALQTEMERHKLANKVKLCTKLKLFGKCKSVQCKHRHILSPEADYETKLPKQGTIKFKILHVQSVTMFTVKLLEYTDSNGKIHFWNSYENLERELYQAMKQKRISAFDLKVSDFYVYHCRGDDSYKRCIIETIAGNSINVELIDSGTKLCVDVSALYELPNKFKENPVINCFLANMVPPESDDCWSESSKMKVERLLVECEHSDVNTFVTGQILLQLGNVFWVKNMIVQEKLLYMEHLVTKLNLKKTLVAKNLAAYTEEPLQRLYELCKKADINLPAEYQDAPQEKTIKPDKNQIQPQWAHFDNSKSNQVFITATISPGIFYVRLKKFHDLFANLQNDIQNAVCKPFYPSEFTVALNKCYLAKDPLGDEYCRVKVVAITDDDNVAKCFYVDYGDYASIHKTELKFLTDELITKLPFQVIEVRLYGVRSVDEDWSDTAIDTFSEYIFEPDSDYFRTLNAFVCETETALETIEKYAIVLVDCFKDKPVVINKILIDCGVAFAVESESLDKDFSVSQDPDINPQSNSDEDSGCDKKDSRQICDLDNNNEDDKWDVCINDVDQFLADLMGQQRVSTKAITAAKPPTPQLPTLKSMPPTSSDHCVPDVVWSQTKTHIKIKINLPHIEDDYSFHIIRNNILKFSTTYNGKKYRLEFALFAKVMKTYRRSPSRLHLEVTLAKCTASKWDRLILSTVNLRNIKYDISKTVLPDKEEDDDYDEDGLPKKKILTFGKDVGNEDLLGDNMLVEYGSDDYTDSYSDTDSE